MSSGNANEQQRRLRSAAEKTSCSVPPFSGSPATSSTPAKLWERIENRLDLLTKTISESIVAQIKTEIDVLHMSLSERIRAIENEFNAKIQAVEQKFNDRYSSFNHSLLACSSRITNLEVQCNNIDALQEQLALIQAQAYENDNTLLKHQIDAFERRNPAGVLVLQEIPYTKNENLTDIFQKLCTTLNQTSFKPVYIFRTKPVKKSSSSPVIVKLPHAQIKKQILIAAADYFKTNGRTVTLGDLGFDSNKFVRLYESLTKHNHSLFKKANELRRNKCLHSVFTRDGRVFVKETTTSKPLHINNTLSLGSICRNEMSKQNSFTFSDAAAAAPAPAPDLSIML